MEELLELYKQYKALYAANDYAHHAKADEITQRAAVIVPARELALVEVGYETACCCNGGAYLAVLWCQVNWPDV